MSVNARAALAHTARVVEAAAGYPSLRVDNDEYLRRCRFRVAPDLEELRIATRMRARRWCASGENTRVLCERAVGELMARRPEACSQVDVVVVASGTTLNVAHPVDPANATFADLSPLVLQQLGRCDAVGLDIKACYCTGFVRAMQLMDGLLANPNYRYGLVVAAEQGSRYATAETNRTSFCYIVGDAAGAVLLERGPAAPRTGILDYCGYTDVSKLDWVGIGPDAASIIMKGSRAGEATARMLVQCARTLLERNHLTFDDIDRFIPIQTHRGLLEQVRRELECPEEKLLWHGDVDGFSGSASIPSAIASYAPPREAAPQLVLSVAVGAGMNCGGLLYYV